MNKVCALLLSILLTTLSVSCKKSTDIVEPTGPGNGPISPDKPATEAVTPVAAPEGAIITATIGPAGGILESSDKRIRVNIPAGALTANQTLSMQPLDKNYCPQGTGRAFRLLPHGLSFAKPATLTFHYSEQDINGSAPQLLHIAYQTDKGHWQSPTTTGVDTTAKTVSVQTTHFSDWGLFQQMKISPNQSFISPGDQLQLHVVEIPLGKPGDDDLIVPLPFYLSTQYIEKWTLQGAGTLAHQHNKGTYYAPAKIPAINPAAVTVFLNKSVTINGHVFKDIRLVANVFVAPEGISFQVGKDEWQTFPGGANINTSWNVVAGAVGEEHVQVGWKGAPTGAYQWTAGLGASFLYANGKFHRSHMYFKEVSGGLLRVDNDDPQWVTGTFTLTRSGWIDASSAPPTHGTSTVVGVFRVKRV